MTSCPEDACKQCQLQNKRFKDIDLQRHCKKVLLNLNSDLDGVASETRGGLSNGLG
jgi:hypothetical protein